MKDMHNLGIFDSLVEVWDSYPYGGCPGDYVMIGEGVIYWNDERRIWGDFGSDISSDKDQIVEGNLTVDKNLTIGGNIKANNADFNKLVADTLDIKNPPYALKNHNHDDVYATKEHKHLLEDVIDSGEGVVVPGKIENAKHADVAHDLDKKSPVNERFISKKGDDTATGLITFLEGLISEGLVEANNGLVVRKKELIEEALTPFVEENEDSLVEELSSSPVVASTLGQLLNVIDSADETSSTDDILVRLAGSGKWTINSTLLSKLSNSLELFTEVVPSNDTISIDYAKTPYAKVNLSGESKIFNLFINNVKEGVSGKILVFQTGFKQIAASENIKGTIDLPLNAGTIALLTYNVIGSMIYIHSNTVLGDVQFPTPQRITDFQSVYYDSSVCVVQWSAPYANNIYDKATAYDMRYSNSLVDADDPKVWSGLKKITGVPEPAAPGQLQKMTISGLTPNKEYYIYLKSVKVNYGVEYTSASSDFVYCKTIGSEDTSKAYRISLSERNLIPQLRNYNTDVDGTTCSIDKMVDEVEKNTFLEDGYPNTTNKEYVTFWSTYKYGRDTSPFDIFIDLFSEYAIDKMFVYSRSKPYFSVYGMKDRGYQWVKIGEIKIGYNEWKYLDFSSFTCRFIKISFDQMDFGSSSTNPSMPEGTEAFPDPEFNGSLDRIDNLLLYGRPVSSRPEGIMPPLRKSTIRKTVDQFFCTNGHGYQPGRIHSMCSGERVRMYMHFGQFAANYNTTDAYTRLADMRFRVNQIPWVSGNNGTGEYLVEMLQHTYAKYGLKPFLCNTGVFDYCYYDKTISSHNRPCDGYWYPDAWRPVPKRGVGGLDKYFGSTCNPQSYKTYAKMCAAISAKYGKNQVDGSSLFYPLDESTVTGLDLISGIEPENEPDQNWSGWIGYTHTEEYAAILSAACDGHNGSLIDEEGNPLSGIKSGNILAISSGTASVNRAYYLSAMLKWQAERKDANIPVDVFSMHMYFSNIGSQDSSQAAVQYGITFEQALNNITGGELVKLVEIRNRFAPDKEVALTEFGWGESGRRDGKCKYQCYTQAGRQIGSWIIPDRHRSDVKGAWIVRATIQMMALGIDFVNYYSTETEGNYFDSGQWGSGAGFEMFHWDDLKDETPGAKASAIVQYECPFDRGGFSTTGLFGQLLANGAYPITRSYWWIATMRNRLRGYVYTGMKYIGTDERIVIACFKKQGEDKGAYVVYLNDNQNTGVTDVEIPVPTGIDNVQHVTVYVPNIPNPQDVPNNIGFDQKRTGLPTSRKERYENGAWILVNKPYMPGKFMSYSQAPAIYPENPQEGDEITVLPTVEENPYFPIVGPVNAKTLVHNHNLSAQQYEQDREEWETEPNLDAEGNVIWTVKGNAALSWRQVDAVCDYIDYHPDGIHGRNGNEVVESIIRGVIQTNVSEFPEFFFFDAVPEPDYRSKVTDFSSRVISSSAVELWWNNTNTEDTGYQIFISELPETGYTLLKEIAVDIENKASISGLLQDTTYYYKIRPVRGTLVGEMSDYTSAHTFSELPAPDNLQVQDRTATSISLSWAYTSEQVADFVYYALFRADDSGSFMQVGKIEDKSILTYTDTGLVVGHNYTYKMRAVGLNGQSVYTPELATRTLLAEECSPIIRYAMTDKLGVKVILTFDLPIGIIEESAKAKFTLTEDGNLRLITSVARDEANHANLLLTIPQDSLKAYDAKSDIRISFTGGSIQSEYGVELEAFNTIRVSNLIGNFTNIEATYKINLCSSTAPLPADEEWNNIIGNPESDAISVLLADTYGRESTIAVSPIQNKPKYAWGSPSDSGYCEIPEVEEAVYKYLWRGPAYGGDISEAVVARMQFTGLNNEYRYSFRLFGATKFGADLLTKIKINGIYSEVVNLKGNLTSYLVIEDCQAVAGVINLDIVNATEGSNTNYPSISFMILEEYKSNDAPENTDVFLREATILESVDGIVKFPDVTVHLNCIGTALSYRISENQNIDEVEWIDIVDNIMDVPFTLSSGFGTKTIYVQVKNLYSVSNIRVIELEYKDPYVPLVLRNVYINQDDAQTYNREVEVMADKEGIPTHYKISENSDLSLVPWIVWPDPKQSVVPFTLSDGEGQKTVYMQIMDSITTCPVKADTIYYAAPYLTLNSIRINSGSLSTVDTNIPVEFVVGGLNLPTHYMLSESENFEDAEWIEYASSVSFMLTEDLGQKTIYAKIKNETEESLVVSGSISLLERPIEKTIVSLAATLLGSSNIMYYDHNGETVNVIKLGPTSVLKNNEGVDVGKYIFDSSVPGRTGTYSSSSNPVLSGNYGPYPDELINNAFYYSIYNQPETIVPSRHIFELPEGEYKVRILASSSNGNSLIPYLHYSANAVEKQPNLPVLNNFENFVEIDNVVVGADKRLVVKFWSDPTKYVAPINLIEFIKQ